MQQFHRQSDSYGHSARQPVTEIHLGIFCKEAQQARTYILRDVHISADLKQGTVGVFLGRILDPLHNEVRGWYNIDPCNVKLSFEDPNTSVLWSGNLSQLADNVMIPLNFKHGKYYCDVMLESCAPMYHATYEPTTTQQAVLHPKVTRRMDPNVQAHSAFTQSVPTSTSRADVMAHICRPPALEFGYPQLAHMPAAPKKRSPMSGGQSMPSHLRDRKHLRSVVKSVDDLVQLNRAIDAQLARGKNDARVFEAAGRELNLSRTRLGELRRMFSKMQEHQNHPLFRENIKNPQVSLKTLQNTLKAIDDALRAPLKTLPAVPTPLTSLSLEHYQDTGEMGISPRGVATPGTPGSSVARKGPPQCVPAGVPHDVWGLEDASDAVTDNESPTFADRHFLPIKTAQLGSKRSLNTAFVAGTTTLEDVPPSKRLSPSPTTSTITNSQDHTKPTQLPPIDHFSTFPHITTPVSITTDETNFTNSSSTFDQHIHSNEASQDSIHEPDHESIFDFEINFDMYVV